MTAYADLPRPAVLDVVLRTTAALLGTEVVYLGRHTAAGTTLVRVWAGTPGDWPGVEDGTLLAAGASPCTRMLDGAPSLAPDTAGDPAYRDTPACLALGIRAYAGVPVTAPDGSLLGTLAGIDRRPRPFDDAALPALGGLADALGASLHPATAEAGARLRRTREGWVVEAGDEVRPATDLMSAMVVADLLAADIEPGGRPPRPTADLDEAAQLRLSVAQLQHALASRVLIEQAIGVLAERWQVAPRVAFERLRRNARGQGRRVYELAAEIVASTSDGGPPVEEPRRRRGRNPVPNPPVPTG